MAADFTKFRTALNGFHRGDVVAYIEETARHTSEQIRALKQELTEANAQLAAANAKIETLTTENAALQQPATEAEQPQTPTPDWNSEELAAYRRAEAAERLAMDRAQALSQQVRAILDGTSERLSEAGGHATACCDEVLAALTQLHGALEDIQTTCVESVSAMQALQDGNTEAATQ